MKKYSRRNSSEMTSPFKIDDIIDSSLKIAILRVLTFRQDFKATGRQIAKLSGYSVPSTHESLKDLYSRNILNLEIMGKQHIYSLNEGDRIVQKIIRPMFKAERGVKDEIRNFLLEEVKKAGFKKNIISLILYGSTQKGTAKAGSDVDIAVVVSKGMVVQKVTEVFVATIAVHFKSYFGMQLDAYVKSAEEFRKRVKKNQPPVSTLMKSYFVLYGKEPLEV